MLRRGCIRWERSAAGLTDRMHPPMRVGCGAVLDREQRIADVLGDFAGVSVTHRQLTTAPHQPAEWRHDGGRAAGEHFGDCLLYTSDAADEEDSVDLGGRRIIKK